ncbi:MAG: glycosyl hydrolase [Verrucomicrobiota bacterium]
MNVVGKIERELQKDASAYRGKPFFSWNNRLKPEELRRQIRIMKQMGLGGFFMHSRVGLDTPYLGEAWFACIEACVDEAKQLGMEAWLYDEDRWPSGAAGGLVTADPEFRMRAVECEALSSVDGLRWDADVLAVFSAVVEGDAASEVVRIQSKEKAALPKGHELLVFRIVVSPESEWYNGQTYLDTMNPKAVERFVEVTHEQYKEHFGDEFGKTIPGIFADEPHHGTAFSSFQSTNSGHALPWTGAFAETFRERYGYDILDHLVEFFYEVDGEKIRPARHNYHDCAADLFAKAFCKTIGDWCEEAGIVSTGHMLFESPLSYQAHVEGSVMRSYEYMQAPGLDLLTEYHREFDTAKQVSSVARQFGRKWRLTETYGCTGWQFPFSGHKAVGDWQLALGINLRCQHLYWYSMEGEAKRDYPASIGHQSPWWEAYSKVEDYFARAHAVMTRGHEVRDLLVIHPIESTWAIFHPGWMEDREIQAMDQSLVDLSDTLLGANIDFDYGDEDILARHAEIVKGKGQSVFKVGEAEYTTVLVPPMITMRSSTLERLKAFREAGGDVVFSGSVATHLDVEPSGEVKCFADEGAKAPAKGAALAEAVENARRVSIADGAGAQIPDVLYLLREDGDAWYLFVCNTGEDFVELEKETPVAARKNTFPDVRINGFAGVDGAAELDLDTGEWYRAETVAADGGIEIKTSFEQLGSRVFVVPKKTMGDVGLSVRNKLEPVSSRALEKAAWDVSFSEEPGCLVLDRPAFRIKGGEWRGNEEILRIDRLVRESLGLPRRGGHMRQPWSAERHGNPESVAVELRYGFEVKDLPQGGLSIGIECPERYRIFLNGNEVSTDADCGWWVDKSLRRVSFPATLLRLGENELKLVCDYDENHPGLEMVYLLGHFGSQVSGTRVFMVEAPRSLEIGDWTKQGLAFYSGNVGYRTEVGLSLQEGQRLFLRVPAYEGVAVRIWVDSTPVGVIAWEPNEIDITDHLTGSKAQLSIEILSHRSNSHGPFHLNQDQPFGIGPYSYVTQDEDWRDDYRLLPCGLTAAPELVVKEEQ